jgi:hypothetical protein
MEQDRSTLLNNLVDTFEQQAAKSGGTLNQAMRETLDQVFRLFGDEGCGPEDGAERIDTLGPSEFQNSMDAEILTMLTTKLAELDSLGRVRTLTHEELLARTAIINFAQEIESGPSRGGR